MIWAAAQRQLARKTDFDESFDQLEGKCNVCVCADNITVFAILLWPPTVFHSACHLIDDALKGSFHAIINFNFCSTTIDTSHST